MSWELRRARRTSRIRTGTAIADSGRKDAKTQRPEIVSGSIAPEAPISALWLCGSVTEFSGNTYFDTHPSGNRHANRFSALRLCVFATQFSGFTDATTNLEATT